MCLKSKVIILIPILWCFLQASVFNELDKAPQVDIDNDEFKGSIVGKVIREKNIEYMAFRGIPYAQPPIHELRFKDPQKLSRFEGILDARYDGYECCSITAKNESENCLNLNVYTKQLDNSQLLPVLVVIHPGGLYLGSGASYFMNPSHMMSQDVVIVTFNYRLGTLGFLNLGTTDIPGNAGFKDQVFALRWTKKFIKNFGGNPQDITLLGYSAGAFSIQFHLMSTMSKDLFRQAIVMSGSVAPQLYLPKGQQKYLAVRQAKRLECAKFQNITEEIPYGLNKKFADYENISSTDILECLNGYNGSIIAHTLRQMFDYPKDNPIFLWLPVIEKDFKQERFLNENLEVHQKSVLIGYTNGELCESSEDILQVEDKRKEISDNFYTFAPRAFLYERHAQRDVITRAILQKYFNGSEELTPGDYDALCDLFSDSILRFGAHKLAQFMALKGASVYFYEFAFIEDLAHGRDADFPVKQARCDHMMDFQYLFNWLNRRHDTEQQRKIIKLYTGFLYDFIKNGKLTDAQAKSYPHAYALIKEDIEYKEGRNFENYDFWLQLFPQYFNIKLK